MNIHTSRTSRLLTIIEATLHFFEGRYPAYFKQCIDDMTALRGASVPSYKARGEDVYVSTKIPYMLFAAVRHVAKCQGIEPPFGTSMDDIALMTRVAKALDAHVPVKQGCALVLPPGFHQRIFGEQHADQTATGDGERPAEAGASPSAE